MISFLSMNNYRADKKGKIMNYTMIKQQIFANIFNCWLATDYWGSTYAFQKEPHLNGKFWKLPMNKYGIIPDGGVEVTGFVFCIEGNWKETYKSSLICPTGKGRKENNYRMSAPEFAAKFNCYVVKEPNDTYWIFSSKPHVYNNHFWSFPGNEFGNDEMTDMTPLIAPMYMPWRDSLHCPKNNGEEK